VCLKHAECNGFDVFCYESVQIRDTTLGYRTSAPPSSAAPEANASSSVDTMSSSDSSATLTVVTSVSHMKSIGSKSCKKKATVSGGEEEAMDATAVLEHITLDLEQGAKIAIVGKNGAGKRYMAQHGRHFVSLTSFTLSYVLGVCAYFVDSTLLRLLVEHGEIAAGGELDLSSPVVIRGEMYKNPAMRIAYYQQLQQESLPYALSPLQHLTDIAPEGHNEQTLRAHLGAFGLGGDLALQPIGVLSGGQKSRVVFAELTLNK
jgi:ATPase subunit of ABC transporter with duplicated ATPase domains